MSQSLDRIVGIVLFTLAGLSTVTPWFGVGIFTVPGISTAAGMIAAASYVVAVVMLATGRTGYWSAMAGGPGLLAVVAWIWLVRQQEAESARLATDRASEGLANLMIGGAPTVLPGAFAAGFLGLAACFLVLACSLWRSWKVKRIC